MGEFAVQAAHNIQDTLGDQLYNVLQENFQSIGDSFKATLDRMVANVLAIKLGQKLFGDFDKTGRSAVSWRKSCPPSSASASTADP